MAAVIVVVVVFRVSMVVVMGVQKVTVSLGRSHWRGHTESDESKPEEESVVVVKPEVKVAKSPGDCSGRDCIAVVHDFSTQFSTQFNT